MKPKLKVAFDRVTAALVGLAPMFTCHRLTFVARCTDPALDADVITSQDSIEAVAAVLRDHADRDRAAIWPEALCG